MFQYLIVISPLGLLATNVKRDSGTKRGQAKKSHRVSLD